MAARSLASLTLSFGLVNVPVKLYSATESKGSVSFNLLAPDGSRVKQQYVSATTGKLVERAQMNKGYEFERDRFVVFTAEELKSLDESASHLIEIVCFVPLETVDPIYYDKAYYLAPDKRGAKPYALLREAMVETGRCALARWVTKGKQYVAQVRAAGPALVLQQLLYADEVRTLEEIGIEDAAVTQPELALAVQLIGSIAQDAYHPEEFQDEEKARILAAIDRKIAGRQVIEAAPPEQTLAGSGGQVIDLMAALRASLAKKPGKGAAAPAKAGGKAAASAAAPVPAGALRDRKPARRVAKAAEQQPQPVAAAPARVRARR